MINPAKDHGSMQGTTMMSDGLVQSGHVMVVVVLAMEVGMPF